MRRAKVEAVLAAIFERVGGLSILSKDKNELSKYGVWICRV